MKPATVRGMPQRDGFERELHNALTADFVRIELELADTFCELALQCHSTEHERQYVFNARRAMDMALDALTKVHIKEEELEGVVTKIEETKALLESLEKAGDSHPSC
jgi:vacuolar-type H+-ATPase subunit D/Vma8